MWDCFCLLFKYLHNYTVAICQKQNCANVNIKPIMLFIFVDKSSLIELKLILSQLEIYLNNFYELCLLIQVFLLLCFEQYLK